MNLPLIIGIAGGTGSGKTTLVGEIIIRFKDIPLAIIPFDSYYKDQKLFPCKERSDINYDHPDSLDTSLLFDHIAILRKNKSVSMPVYNFRTHMRTDECKVVKPGRIIIVEGILGLAFSSLRRIMDIKIFIDTEADIRFIRRLQRDICERGRSLESVIEQYIKTVKPMHHQFVEPSKSYADIIVQEGGLNTNGIDKIIAKVRSELKKRTK